MQKKCQQPEELVDIYYQALYGGDFENLKTIMTEESYYMALEPFSIKLSIKDPLFKVQWEKIAEDENALHDVEKKISTEVLSQKLLPKILIKETEETGLKRKVVYFDEGGKHKKLSFSKQNCQWVIDYFAGRPVSPTYFSRIKHWIKSLFKKCC